MKSTVIQINADSVRNQIADTSAPALDPADCQHLPIVDMTGGRVEIIDGYHRIAGMLAYGATTISVVTCDDKDVLADAANAEQPEKQQAAVSAIYAAM
jgi:hypothetical protein